MKLQFIFILVISCFSCSNTNQEKQDLLKIVDATNTNLQLDNGILYYNSYPFSGVLKNFDSINETVNTTEYLNGRKDGKQIKKYPNDSIAQQRFYKNGHKIGVHKGWWKNGNMKFKYHFNSKGNYHGIVKEWYKNGQQFKSFNYLDGKEEGSQMMWDLNGKIRANYVVKNGEKFGVIGLKKCYSIDIKNEKY